MQVYCTQSPFPNSHPLLTSTSSVDTQTQFCLSLCGVSGSWCAQGMFKLSEHLWWVWSLVLNKILPLLLSWWGFLAFGRGVCVCVCVCVYAYTHIYTYITNHVLYIVNLGEKSLHIKILLGTIQGIYLLSLDMRETYWKHIQTYWITDMPIIKMTDNDTFD